MTYDIVFSGESSIDRKGFSESLEYCRWYIDSNNGTDESYFGDYKGGTVMIVCNETDEVVYKEAVR